MVVLDQFNNPVSNVPIDIEALPPVPPIMPNKAETYVVPDDGNIKTSTKNISGTSGSSMTIEVKDLAESAGKLKDFQPSQKSTITGRCDEYSPAKVALESCVNFSQINVPACAVTSGSITSGLSWNLFSRYNGRGLPATRFPIKISSPGLDDKIINSYNGFEIAPGNYGGEGVFYAGDNFDGPNGEFLGGKPDSSINSSAQPLHLTYASDGTIGGCVFVQRSMAEIGTSRTVATSGGATLTVGGSTASWDIDYQLGNMPEANVNKAIAEDGYFGGVDIYPNRPFTFFSYILPSSTVQATMISRSPEEFILNDDSITSTSTRFQIEILPASYRPVSMSFLFYEENEVKYTYDVAYPVSSVIDVVLPSGFLIDVEKSYYMEVILNEDTEFKMSYDKELLTGFSRRLISSVNCDDNNSPFSSGSCGGNVISNQIISPISLSTEIDLPNASVCRSEGFSLSLNVDARVSIEAQVDDVDGNPGNDVTFIISNELLTAGDNLIMARADDFGSNSYTLKITAVAEDNGDQEVIYGRMISSYDLSNSLPIGHATVKGIDLADGSMVYSKKDISLISPGMDLEFIRTYSSTGRHDLGPMGYGWSHNYLSRVIVGNCGQVTVTGADGGSARFQIQGDQFIPLKG
ncbi:MAG: DUF6531 domain-containing protein, partial [Candidatus Marinimicrobia bacterium]|nr:DUF6531 domain-containing protein [Candidatus Neomarinimicrobiota bacterium]